MLEDDTNTSNRLLPVFYLEEAIWEGLIILEVFKVRHLEKKDLKTEKGGQLHRALTSSKNPVSMSQIPFPHRRVDLFDFDK